MHQSQACLTRYYRIYCKTFILHASWFCFLWLVDMATHDSFTHCRDSWSGNSLFFYSEFMLVFKLTKHLNIICCCQWPYTDTSVVVSASKSFIHHMVGPTDVTKVLRMISDPGGPRLLTDRQPSGLRYKTVENTFSGEAMKEQFFSRGVLLEHTGNYSVKHKSRW